MAEPVRPYGNRRSRFHRLVAVMDVSCRYEVRASAIVVDDHWGEWRGVISLALNGHVGERVIVSTPEGSSVGVIDDATESETLVIGLEPAPFLL